MTARRKRRDTDESSEEISSEDWAASKYLAERLALLRLARTNGIGPMNFARLLGLYGTAQRALKALPERLARLQSGREIPEIPTLAQIEDEIAALDRVGARHVLRSDADYPLLLTRVPDAPPLLFVRGNCVLLSKGGVGIVGARNASAAGIRLAESFAAELAAAGECVVSGLARGIDTAAHEAALYPGLTVAALAGGLDQPYPPENARLQEEIAERGCLVTEAPPGTVPQARHFPRRNRLIAGMTAATLVVEAAERSGTLITARLATEYERVVMAVPGSPLDPRSRGGNRLLKEGAVLVENVGDILEALPTHLPARQPAPWQFPPLPPLFEARGISQSEKPVSESASLKTGSPKTGSLCDEETAALETVKRDAARNEPTSHASRPTDRSAVDGPTENYATPFSHATSLSQAALQTVTETAATLEETADTANSALSAREKLLPLLSHTPIAVDEVVARCQFSVSTVMTVLSELELDGVVACLPGGQVVRLPERD